jgi:hypothetical protein
VTEREEPYERYRRLMPKTQDLSLIVLKGHLLIEEQFDFFLEELSRRPQFLEQARLTFMQKFRLIQALSGLSRRDDVTKFVERINSLRNKLSHSAEVGQVEEIVDGAMKAMFEQEFFRPHSPRQRATFLRQAFAYAIASIHGHASGFTVAVRPEGSVRHNPRLEPTRHQPRHAPARGSSARR